MVPYFYSTLISRVLEIMSIESRNCFDSSGFEVLAVIMHGRPFCFVWCNFFGCSLTSVTVCTVKTAGDEHIVQSSLPGHD